MRQAAAGYDPKWFVGFNQFQTRAEQNLMKMTEGMPYYPGSQCR